MGGGGPTVTVVAEAPPRDTPSAVRGDHRFGRSVLVAVGVAVLMRARFLVTPISVDEGGYLAVARAWGRGARLYDDVWVDRPQVLMVEYRLLHQLGLGSPVGVRILGLLACVIGTVACAHIAALLMGEQVRTVSIVIVGVLVSLPQIEGFTANAELLSASVGAVSLALCLEAARRVPVHTAMMVAAGIAGGAAVCTKQSGFDALGAAFVAVAIVGVAGAAARARAHAVGLLLLGVAVPLSVCALHGALTGWDRWWFAVVGYRTTQRSVFVGARFDRFAEVWEVLTPALWPVVVVLVAAAAAGLAGSPRSRRAVVIIGSWSLLAIAGFALGGQFFRHYWTILAFPAGTAAGMALGALRRPTLRRVALIGVLIGPALLTVDAIRLPRNEVGLALHDDRRLVASEQVAQWFEANATAGDELYVLCANAAVYGNVDTDPPYPYLWFDGVRQIPGAPARLIELLSGPDRPAFVAQFQRNDVCDPSGAVARALREHYTRLRPGLPVPVYVANDERQWTD